MPLARRLAVACALAPLLFAGPAALAVRDAGPAAVPSRVVLGWDGDPATSQAVSWRTEQASTPARGEIAMADAARPDVREVTAVTTTVSVSGSASAFRHTARFDRLLPATRYRYRVGDGTTWSDWYAFTTASAAPAPFTFIFLGDAQLGLMRGWPAVVEAARARAPEARLVVHAGDLVDDGSDDELWRQWASGLGPMAATVPSLPVPGNHDHVRPWFRPKPRQLELWRSHFALPDNGLTHDGAVVPPCYFVDYQGVRFIAIDVDPFADVDYPRSERPRLRAAIVGWLKQVLADNPNRWTVVVQHHPCYGVARRLDYEDLREALTPLYEQGHVDLVLQGHDHVYARSKPLRGGRVAGPGEAGVVYLTSVSGEKAFAVNTTHGDLMERITKSPLLYQVVTVEGGRLRCESRRVDGLAIDAFELKK